MSIMLFKYCCNILNCISKVFSFTSDLGCLMNFLFFFFLIRNKHLMWFSAIEAFHVSVTDP